VAVYFADIDGLKRVNDLLGYTAGDHVIAETERRITDWAAARQGRVFRLEADLFAIITPLAGDRPASEASSAPGAADADASAAEDAGRRLRELMAQPVVVDGTTVARTASIGVAFGRVGAMSVADLLVQADDALAAARLARADSLVSFRPQLRSDAVRQAEIELRLADHVAAGLLTVEYQPEFDVRDGAVVGLEALTRWDHPTLGRLLPNQFIGIAERSTAISLVGQWVLREACAQLARWRQEFPALELVMRVNVSPRQLADDSLPDLLTQTLAATALAPAQLCVELTELVRPPDIAQMARVLSRVRELGVAVALDDVGTGHNSLLYLRSLPIDALKVDREFVAGLGRDPTAAAIVGALAHLAHALGLDLVAEGVDSIETIAVLERLGCYRAQGHLLAPASSAEALRPLLARGRLPTGWRDPAAEST
jgi:diguanylate cyclase (GGDEF)-like protein